MLGGCLLLYLYAAMLRVGMMWLLAGLADFRIKKKMTIPRTVCAKASGISIRNQFLQGLLRQEASDKDFAKLCIRELQGVCFRVQN